MLYGEIIAVCSHIHTKHINTGLFISPSGTSKLDCATTKNHRPRPASSFRSAQAATLLEFHVALTNCFVRRWFCAVHGPKPPLHRHNWLSFGKFQDRERFLIHCARHFSSRLPRSGGTCKYAKASSTKKIERFSTYWYAPFCRVCLGCCAVEFGISGGTYE